jgi:hypothetical protein
MRQKLADGGLRDVQHLGGPADRARLDDRLEGLDLAQVRRSFHCMTWNGHNLAE